MFVFDDLRKIRREISNEINRIKDKNTLNLCLINTESPPGVSYRFDILLSFSNSCLRLIYIFLQFLQFSVRISIHVLNLTFR